MNKKLKILSVMMIALFAFSSCKNDDSDDSEMSFNEMYDKGVTEFTLNSFTINAVGQTDRIYVKSNEEIVLLSKVNVDELDELGNKPAAPEYNLSGEFNGKIINKTKASVLNLSGVTLTNAKGPAIYGEKKIELSAKKGTTNTITCTGTSSEKIAAVYCEKAIEIGGKGTLNITSAYFHGVKGGDVKLKGGVNLTIEGKATNGVKPDGSAINCETFLVEEDKTFTAAFKGFKHGIKADQTIDISSGNFDIASDIEVVMKTDIKALDGKDHHINLEKCVFTVHGNSNDPVDKILSDTVSYEVDVFVITD